MGRINYKKIALSMAGAEEISTVQDINEDDFILIPSNDYGFVLRQVTRSHDFLYAGNVDLRSIIEPEENYNEPDWIVRINPEFELTQIWVKLLILDDLGLRVEVLDLDGNTHGGILTAIGKNCLFVDDKKIVVSTNAIISIDRD